MVHCFKIYENDHFYKRYEDRKYNLYILYLTDDVEEWIDENIIGEYDISYGEKSDETMMVFDDETDAMAFKLQWL